MSRAVEEARALRLKGRYDDAHKLLTSCCARERPNHRLAQLVWQHHPKWWRPIEGPRARLVRRGPSDIALVRRCWSDKTFMTQFNQYATPLPDDDAALKAVLAQEHVALLEEQRALHWTIRIGDSTGVGFVSLVDIAFRHRRAEFLIGVVPETHPWIAPEAAHLALEFAATVMKLERITAYMYAENSAAVEMAVKLGFESEGILRGYLAVPGSTQRADLVVAGLLLDQGFFERSARIRRRLLKRM